ncbi:hypothetical protein J2T46_001262 [Pseudomonas citronellolis]|nr:hypothetical protein [Pseudomonas citronellolis]MCP1654673.1 hypothetical protein [Pseudomonas citronellolis]MCP1721329.1 hypothetical protein [Pseudomonas citronellolis]
MREPRLLVWVCLRRFGVLGCFLFRPLGRVPFVKRWKATPAKRNQKGLPQHTGPMEPGYPHELPRHGGPPRGYVPVAHGALATSMSHDLLSAGFARPSEGAFRCARMFLWKSQKQKPEQSCFAFRRSELAREPRSHWVPAFTGMTRGSEEYQDDSELPVHSGQPPLPSGRGAQPRAGERVLLNPTPTPPGNSIREQARSYRKRNTPSPRPTVGARPARESRAGPAPTGGRNSRR